MFSEDEVFRRFPDSLLLKNTVDAICSRLERVSMLAASEHVTELMQHALDCKRSRNKSTESSNASESEDEGETDVPDVVETELSLAIDDTETLVGSTTPTVALYDPAQAQEQLDGELPRSENALESLLQIMVTPRFEQRALALPETGMAQACRDLMTEFPNLSEATELIAGAVSLAERHQLPIQLPRLHIDGAPGCGKTQWLRRVADILKLPLVVISMSATHGDFELAGCNRVYRGAEPGRLIKSLLTLKVANPIYLFDEAELGHPLHYGPLLSFLEDPWFTDSFFEMPFRTEYVNKVFITNYADLLSPAIRSRLYRINVEQPTAEEMRTIVQRLYTNLRNANRLLSGFPELLAAELVEWLSKKPLREARKLLEAALYRAACRHMHDDTLQLSMDDLIPQKNRPHFEFPAGHA